MTSRSGLSGAPSTNASWRDDRPGAFELLWPQLSEAGKEAARLLALEIVRDVPKARREALLARWRKESGWTVQEWKPAWKRPDLALAYYLLARKQTVPESGNYTIDGSNYYGTGIGQWHHRAVVSRLRRENREAGLWPAVAAVALALEMGETLGEARDEAEGLIKRFPKDPVAFLVGRVVWDQGWSGKEPDHTRAMAYVRKAMELGPNLATPPFLLGWNSLDKDPKKADAYFRRFVAIQKKAGRSVERERAALAKRGYRLPD